ncbi:MAG: hypothetical protein ACE5E9_11400 [Nitrospinaceae bacterium]
MKIIFRIILAGWLLPAFFPPALGAFDDDSTDDTRSLVEIRTICGNGRTVFDSVTNRSSCQGDDVYLNQLQTSLFKNEVELIHQNILDFKVARNGNVYYRTRIGPYLYNEKGRLDSNGGPVTLYLASSSGDVIYLNARGDIFKNGKELNRGPAPVRVKEADIFFQGRRFPLVQNPAVSRNGKAVYLNTAGHLFVEGIRINPIVSNVIAFKLNSRGDVYFLDDNHRLYRNSYQLFDGRFNILEFQLSNRGQVAYLTNSISNNLFLENQVMPAGAHRVVSFRFNSRGDIVYQDELGRIWRNGVPMGN